MGSGKGLRVGSSTGVCAGGNFVARETVLAFSICAEPNVVCILEGVLVPVEYWNISG